MHNNGESCGIGGIKMVLPIWKIEERVMGSEAREQNVNRPDHPNDFVLMNRECAQAQMSPLPCPICRVFLELFKNFLKL